MSDNTDTQGLMRTLFLHLVTPDHTRAIASIAELSELSARPGEVKRLIDQLVDARLLVTQSGDEAQGATVEIVHEALIDGWPQLRLWLDESHDDQAYLEQLRVAARQWDARGRSSGLLWRGEIAQDATQWRRRYRGAMSGTQREFLDAVASLATRTARIKRIAVVGVIVFLSLLVVVGSIALVKIREAERQARENARVAEMAADEAKKQEVIARQHELEARKQASNAEYAEFQVREKAREMSEQGLQILELLSSNRSLGQKYRHLLHKFKQTMGGLTEPPEGGPGQFERRLETMQARIAVAEQSRDQARRDAENSRQEALRAREIQAALAAERDEFKSLHEGSSRAAAESRIRAENAEQEARQEKQRVAARDSKIRRLEKQFADNCVVVVPPHEPGATEPTQLYRSA